MRGTDKLLEPVDGTPLLRHMAKIALASGLPVTVALPPDRPERARAVADLPLSLVTAEGAHEGMAVSLSAGLRAVPEDAAVLVLLADLPEIDTQDLTRMREAQHQHPDRILRATAADGTPGHPVVFPPGARGALHALKGDEGARAVLRAQAAKVIAVPLPQRHATTDLDTPEDWAAWRLARDVRA